MRLWVTDDPYDVPDDATIIITGEDFRRDWNLPSTLFTITSVD